MSQSDTWTTRDGRVIPINTMGDRHLVNTIAMLRRNAERHRLGAIWQLFGYLDSDPPDGAYMAAQSEVSQLEEADADEVLASTVPAWPALIAAARRRGLEPTE